MAEGAIVAEELTYSYGDLVAVDTSVSTWRKARFSAFWDPMADLHCGGERRRERQAMC